MAHIHLIGIGGAGLSAIATVLLQQGHTVSGSDMHSSANTTRLTDLGATVYLGHRPENLPERVDTVVVSSAVPSTNPELQAAHARHLNVVKRATWLGQMMQNQTGITLAGTHGKTTTTALTAYLLQQLQQDPTYIIGGYVPQMQSNAAAGNGGLFVIEADEYDHTFLGLKPDIAVLTIVEWDHPDIFPTPQSLHQAFVDFARLVPPEGHLIVYGDDPGVQRLLADIDHPAITYGFTPSNDCQLLDLQPNQHGAYDFRLHYAAHDIPVSIQIPGRHNVANVAAALLVIHQLGLNMADAARHVSHFSGVGRRFEWKGEVNDIIVIDDYAHHPTEIRATLSAARTRFPQRRLWAMVQPHTFSRTKTLLADFAQACEQADQVVVVDIYASRETDDGSIHSQELVRQMNHPQARYIGPLAEATAYFVAHLQPGDVLITMGAGDGYLVGERFLAQLAS